MGQSLFFPQQATADTPSAESSKDSSRPKSRTSRGSVEPASTPAQDKPTASTEPPDPPENNRSPSLPQCPLPALTPSPLPTPPEKPKEPSRAHTPSLFQFKRDWRRPWGGAVSEHPKPPVPSRASPALKDRPKGPARSEPDPTPPPLPPRRAETACQSGDSDRDRTWGAVPVFEMPPNFVPAKKAPDLGQPRFQFGKNQDFDAFLASLQSQSAARKTSSMEECSLKSPKEYKALKTGSSFKLPSLMSSPFQSRSLTSSPFKPANLPASPFQPPSLMSSPFQPPNLPASPFQPPSLTSSPFQPPNIPASPFQPPSLTSSPFQPPNIAASPFQPPSLTSSPFQPPNLPASPFQPSNLPASPFQWPSLEASPFKPPNLPASPFQPPNLKPSPFKQPSQTPSPFNTQGQTSSPIKSQSLISSPNKYPSQTSSPIKSASQTSSPKKVPSQATASPGPSAKAANAISGTGREKQTPSKTSVKQASTQMTKPPTGAAPSPLPSEQGSLELLVSSGGGAEGGGVAQKGAARSAEREHRLQRLRKRQSELAAARRGKAPTLSHETKQNAQAANTPKPLPHVGPDLRIQGASPVFSVPPPRPVFSVPPPPRPVLPPSRPVPPPSRPVPTPPVILTFSNARNTQEKPSKEAAKASTQAQFSSTGPSPPKLSFPFGKSGSPKPQKLGEAPSREGLSSPRGWCSTTVDSTLTPTIAIDTGGAPSTDPPHVPALKVQPSPGTPLKARRKLLKGATPPVTAARRKPENEEGKCEQPSSASITPPPKPPAPSPQLPHSPQLPQPPPLVSPATADILVKPMKKLRFKIPFELCKGDAKAVTVVRAEKKEKEKKERKEEAVPALPPSPPPPPQAPEQPSSVWPPFTTEQGCSRKARCRHQSSAGLPRNVTRWLNVRPNYLCEPPWVTTATLAASVALILSRDGTFKRP